MQPREKVEIEASHGHDGVVYVFLVWDNEISSSVPDEDKVVVVGGPKRSKERRTGGEERDILDVWVVFLNDVINNVYCVYGMQ